MLRLAEMVMAAYAFVGMSITPQPVYVPMPVVIESTMETNKKSFGAFSYYATEEDAIYLRNGWSGDCTDQKEVIKNMLLHFSKFLRQPYHFNKEERETVEDAWVCLDVK